MFVLNSCVVFVCLIQRLTYKTSSGSPYIAKNQINWNWGIPGGSNSRMPRFQLILKVLCQTGTACNWFLLFLSIIGHTKLLPEKKLSIFYFYIYIFEIVPLTHSIYSLFTLLFFLFVPFFFFIANNEIIYVLSN